MKKNSRLQRHMLVLVSTCWSLMLMQQAIPKNARAADFSFATSLGYDDNPAQTSEQKGSGFILHWASLSETLTIGSAAFKGLLESSYQNYTQVEDNYLLKARGELSWPLPGGRLVPALLMEANTYNDKYVREDGRDQYLAGLRLSWIYSRHITFSVEGTWSKLNYRHKSIYADPLQTTVSAAPSGKDSTLKELAMVRISRNDHLAGGDARCEFFLSPSVYGTISAGYAHLHSTDYFETYRQLHADAFLSWDMTERWRLQLGAGLQRNAYDKSPQKVERTDHAFFASGQISRFFGPAEIYGKVSWLKNNSKINDEFYHQMVTQCGFCWYF